ncbi:MAG: MGH1-like glycoside hydrolase domain-containing protein [Bdellovibrionota bacterium]
MKIFSLTLLSLAVTLTANASEEMAPCAAASEGGSVRAVLKRQVTPGDDNPLKKARRNVVNLVDWRFHLDPEKTGEKIGWKRPDFDDSGWPTIKATATWQEQGNPGYQGDAWYRSCVRIPAAWSDSKLLLQTTGIYNEYDLYVNGTFVKHFGDATQSVAWDPTEPDITPYLKYGAGNEITLKVSSAGDKGGIYRRIQLRRVPPFEPYKKYLPLPTIEGHPELVNLYWQSWRMAFKNVSFGTKENRFVEAYMEEGYNEQIYQWDSIFMSMYGRYGGRLFPAMPTLDNFYQRQATDGHIARVYSKTDGKGLIEPVKDEFTMTNPPLFAWSEWDYFRMTGDDSRLARVFPVLERYDDWLKKNQSSKIVKGMYWQTGYDSGMDNMPRPNADSAGWVDATLEQAVAARYLAKIAGQLKDKERTKYWLAEFADRKEAVNRLAWNRADGFYYDVDKDGKQTGVKHIGAMWAMLAGVADPEQAKRLQEHLHDPNEFYRPHLFPALAASDPGYTKEATYWRGGVWAPTNYMVIHGLKNYGFGDFAYEAAMNHLENMAKVYSSKVDETHVDPNEASKDYRTIWECYNPDQVTPCTRADTVHYGRQDFAGWTALGPIALTIQEAIGLDIIGSKNRVVWNLREPSKVGLANVELQKGRVFSVLAEPSSGGKRIIKTESAAPFSLVIKTAGKNQSFSVPAGKAQFVLKSDI